MTTKMTVAELEESANTGERELALIVERGVTDHSVAERAMELANQVVDGRRELARRAGAKRAEIEAITFSNMVVTWARRGGEFEKRPTAA